MSTLAVDNSNKTKNNVRSFIFLLLGKKDATDLNVLIDQWGNWPSEQQLHLTECIVFLLARS